MGVLQNSINTMLGTLGVAAKLSPAVQRGVELRELKEQGEKVGEQLKTAQGAQEAPYKGRSLKKKSESAEKALTSAELSYQLASEAEKIAEKTYKLSATPENLEKLKETKSQARISAEDVSAKEKAYEKSKMDIELKRQEDARKRALKKAKAKGMQTQEMNERRSILLDARGENIIVKEAVNGR